MCEARFSHHEYAVKIARVRTARCQLASSVRTGKHAVRRSQRTRPKCVFIDFKTARTLPLQRADADCGRFSFGASSGMPQRISAAVEAC